MGQDKAMLQLAGEPVISHLVKRFKALFGWLAISSNQPASLPDLGVPVLEDDPRYRYRGPLAGIEAGLSHMPGACRNVFVCACDLPFASVHLAQLLIQRLEESDAEAIVPRSDGYWQPLCAVYRTSILPLVRGTLDEAVTSGDTGANPSATGDCARSGVKMRFLLDRLETIVVPQEELLAADIAGNAFLNMNRPQDWERVKKLFKL